MTWVTWLSAAIIMEYGEKLRAGDHDFCDRLMCSHCEWDLPTQYRQIIFDWLEEAGVSLYTFGSLAHPRSTWYRFLYIEDLFRLFRSLWGLSWGTVELVDGCTCPFRWAHAEEWIRLEPAWLAWRARRTPGSHHSRNCQGRARMATLHLTVQGLNDG